MNCSLHQDRNAVGACTCCGNFVCQECATNVNGKVVCKTCLAQGRFNTQQPNQSNGKQSDWLVTLLLCAFLGGIGAHRFYAGKIGSGIVQLLTLGGCGIWSLIDLIMVLCGKFTDSNGVPIER